MKTTKYLFDILLVLFFAGLCFVVLVGSLAPYLSVKSISFIQFFPILITFTIPLLLIGIYYFYDRSKVMMGLSILTLLISVWVGAKDVRLFSSSPEASKQKFTVASFNVRTFSYDPKRIDSVAQLLDRYGPDVVCLQEFRNDDLPNGRQTDDYIADLLKMPYFKFVTLPIHIQGGMILSRYPIVKIDTLYLPVGEINSGILATIETPGGKVGIVNMHLSSFHLQETIGKAKKEGGWRGVLRSLGSKGVEVLIRQEDKVGSVLAGLKDYPYPIIIAGDLNAVPHTRIANQLAKQYKDSFIERGRGAGWTYPVWMGMGMRIDYQFFSDNVEVLKHEVIKTELSDHYPVICDYDLVAAN